jgi:eukaryotic-like serine/threonine-protein kinase
MLWDAARASELSDRAGAWYIESITCKRIPERVASRVSTLPCGLGLLELHVQTPSPMSLDPLGRYEILQELGRGAMGVVYKARDPLIDRMVAVKSVDLDASTEEVDAFERRFYREAKSAGRLNHLNIVTIHDVGRSGDSAYIAMEFLEGRSLREIIDSGVVLPQEQIADIAAQVADGLACAHRNGVVHRDIKPANIMLLDSGTVKITDFGIALLPRGSRTMGSVFGSPKYISPEQVVGREADGRSDIFALGAVLYELLTGSPAFTASDLAAVLSQVVNDVPAPPSTRNRNIAVSFDCIVAKAMAKHPDDRYASAQDMAQDLRNFRELDRFPGARESQRTLERRARRRPAGEKTEPDAAPPDPSSANVSPAASNATTNGALSRSRSTILVVVSVFLLVVAMAWALAPKQLPKQQIAPPIATSISGPVAAAKTNEPPLPATPAEASPPPAPTVAATKPPPAAERVGRVAFAVTPWGEIYVDGKRRGISPPLKEVRLSPGKHVVEIRNTNFKRHSETVELAADASVRIKHKFQ